MSNNGFIYWVYWISTVSFIADFNLHLICSDSNVPSYRSVLINDLFDQAKWRTTHKQAILSNYGQILRMVVDSESKNIFIALNNTIVRLLADTLIKADDVSWSISPEQKKQCENNQPSNKICGQYMVTLLSFTENIFPSASSGLTRHGIYVCLSNGYMSECSLRQAANLRGPPKYHWKGNHRCPSEPFSPVVNIRTSTQELYIGSGFAVDRKIVNDVIRIKLDLINNDQTSVKTQSLRTFLGNAIFQTDATAFVASFEFHNAVYFLFRELSKEVIDSCGKSSDNRVISTNLRSFRKAPIVCPSSVQLGKSSDSSFYTNIQSVHLDQQTKTMYASFRTSSVLPTASAICEYNLVDIEKMFDQDERGLCNGAQTGSFGSFMAGRSNVLIPKVIHPRNNRAILTTSDTIWTHIIVDRVPGTVRSDTNLVVFASTERQMIQKWHLTDSKTCLIEEIDTQPNLYERSLIQDGQITAMQKVSNRMGPESSSILVTTQTRLLKISYARCTRLGINLSACQMIRDPFCGWNTKPGTCQDLTDTSESRNNFITFDKDKCDVDEKVRRTIEIRGEWGAWGTWKPCNSFNSEFQPVELYSFGNFVSLSMKNCYCRVRTCSAPFPFGSKSSQCLDGVPIEVANCSHPGGWTSWSSWSECQPNCTNSLRLGSKVVPVRTRHRWCSNPIPLGSTKENCEGPELESEPCQKSIPECPDASPSVLEWSTWSSWSKCSLSCNKGQQFRKRLCGRQLTDTKFESIDLEESFDETNPKLSLVNNLGCLGKAYEVRECNSQPCPATKIISAWTPWYVTEELPNLETRQRQYRVECVANLPEIDHLKAEVEINAHKCQIDTTGRKFCEQPDDMVNEDGHTGTQLESIWSAWSECSQVCGEGVRYRSRSKAPLAKSIDGRSQNMENSHLPSSNIETQEEPCYQGPCTGFWSCWSSWSPCDQPACSVPRGQQRRYRVCMVSGSQFKKQSDYNFSHCKGGIEASQQSKPCDLDSHESSCLNSYFQTPLVASAGIFEQKGSKQTVRKMSSSDWADWSECVLLDHLDYTVRIRTKDDSSSKETIQLQRCDTNQIIPLNTISKLKGASATYDQSFERYSILPLIVVGFTAFVCGFILVLIIFFIYSIVKKDQARKNKPKHQPLTLWRRLSEKRAETPKLLPYSWFARPENLTIKDESNRILISEKPIQLEHHQPLINKSESISHRLDSSMETKSNLPHIIENPRQLPSYFTSAPEEIDSLSESSDIEFPPSVPMHVTHATLELVDRSKKKMHNSESVL